MRNSVEYNEQFKKRLDAVTWGGQSDAALQHGDGVSRRVVGLYVRNFVQFVFSIIARHGSAPGGEVSRRSFDARRNIFPRRDSPMMDSPHLANMINH